MRLSGLVLERMMMMEKSWKCEAWRCEGCKCCGEFVVVDDVVVVRGNDVINIVWFVLSLNPPDSSPES